MSKDLPHIIPASQPELNDIFVVYQTTHQFYQELQVRSEFKSYCEWYYTTAERNRQELEKMRGELNIFQIFRRR
jgi:hypothetical protein